jgi:hypothetical protein
MARDKKQVVRTPEDEAMEKLYRERILNENRRDLFLFAVPLSPEPPYALEETLPNVFQRARYTSSRSVSFEL